MQSSDLPDRDIKYMTVFNPAIDILSSYRSSAKRGGETRLFNGGPDNFSFLLLII